MKKVQVLGPGCARCEKLAEVTKQAADELGIEYTFEKVTDINEIVAFGVMSTPGLVVDGEVKMSGRVPPLDEIKKLLA